MISVEDIQTSIINKLQANAALVSGTYGDIREMNYQGADFRYPNVRVGEINQTPVGQGNCRETSGVFSFKVVAFSEHPSSLECSRIASLVVAALFGKKLSSPSFKTGKISTTGVDSPTRAPTGAWRSDVFFIAHYWS